MQDAVKTQEAAAKKQEGSKPTSNEYFFRHASSLDLLTLASDYLGSPIFGTFVPHTHTQNQKIKGVQSHGPFGSILFVLTAALPVTRVEAIIG